MTDKIKDAITFNEYVDSLLPDHQVMLEDMRQSAERTEKYLNDLGYTGLANQEIVLDEGDIKRFNEVMVHDDEKCSRSIEKIMTACRNMRKVCISRCPQATIDIRCSTKPHMMQISWIKSVTPYSC